MGQAYDDYIASMSALDTATNDVTNLIHQISRIARPLMDDWTRYYLTIPGSGVPMSMVNRRQNVDATDGFPNVAVVHRAMVLHFEALETAKEKWAALPEIEKRNLVLPPWVRK